MIHRVFSKKLICSEDEPIFSLVAFLELAFLKQGSSKQLRPKLKAYIARKESVSLLCI